MGPNPNAYDDDEYDEYVDTGNVMTIKLYIALSIYTGLIEEHYTPVDPTACSQLPQNISQHAAVISSICSRPPSNEVKSCSDQLSECSSTTTLVDSAAARDPWEQEQLNESSKCAEFVRLTCGCSKADGKPCSGLFSEEHYTELRAQAYFLTHEQLDLVILGSIMATIRKDNISHGRHKPAKRQKTMMTYMHHGHHFCACTYNFLGSHRMKHMKASYLMHGLAIRTHGNSNKAQANTLPYQSICHLVKFILNHAEQHAILLPGRIPQLKMMM